MNEIELMENILLGQLSKESPEEQAAVHKIKDEYIAFHEQMKEKHNGIEAVAVGTILAGCVIMREVQTLDK
jgi:hypothetical protein